MKKPLHAARRRVQDWLSRRTILNSYPILRFAPLRLADDPPSHPHAPDARLTPRQLTGFLDVIAFSSHATQGALLTLLGALHPPEQALVLAFHDSRIAALEVLLPHLASRGLEALLFLDPSRLDGPDAPDLASLAVLLGHGVVVGLCLPPQALASTAVLRAALSEGPRALRPHLGYSPTLLSVATERIDGLVELEAREAGFRHILTTRQGLAPRRCPPMMLSSLPVTARTRTFELRDWLTASPMRLTSRIARDRARHNASALRERLRSLRGNGAPGNHF